jgi:hypothetical protein
MPELPTPISHTVEAIYAAIERKARGSDSRGVPMSDAANECERAIWYRLRWASPPEHIDGLKERNFETGRRAEDRILDELGTGGAGFQVERFDPATGRQFAIELASGWLRGRMDGTVAGLPEAPATLHVVEIKTHKEKSFKELLKHRDLRAAKPDHFAQCQSYMHGRGLTRCLYLAENKNTGELYAERVVYDAAYALALEAKIERIRSTDRAPPRLHENPKAKAAFACAWCPAFGVCHDGAWARINCRTCLHADLIDGGVTRCTKSGEALTWQQMQAGCASHRYLPDLVPGEQIDVADGNIVYRLADGSTWVDGEGKR